MAMVGRSEENVRQVVKHARQCSLGRRSGARAGHRVQQINGHLRELMCRLRPREALGLLLDGGWVKCGTWKDMDHDPALAAKLPLELISMGGWV